MAKDDLEKRKPTLEPNPLIAKFVKDPCDVPPDATLVVGYAGKGARSGRVRLYSTPDMDEFFEFDEDEVVHTETRDDPAGGRTFVWLNGSAKLNVTRVESHEFQADFLRGDFTRELMAQTPAALTASFRRSAREISGTSAWWCTWRILGCTRQMVTCTEKVRGMHRTEEFGCDLPEPQSGDPRCESLNCPTQGPLCTVDCTDVC